MTSITNYFPIFISILNLTLNLLLPTMSLFGCPRDLRKSRITCHTLPTIIKTYSPSFLFQPSKANQKPKD